MWTSIMAVIAFFSGSITLVHINCNNLNLDSISFGVFIGTIIITLTLITLLVGNAI